MPIVETGICRICLHFSFLREKRWCRPVKPSRAKPHCGVAFNGSNLSILIFQKEKAHRLVCFFFLEVPARFELANNGFADRGLTTWLRYHIGAGDEARTRYLHLGKVALYRMSYTRISVPGWEP